MEVQFHRVLIYFLLIIVLSGAIYSVGNGQTKSRIVGTIKDEQSGEPLIGANVLVTGTKLGAIADIEGRYYIINVPVGTYTVQASMLGYSRKTVLDVVVSPDRVTTIDFSLKSTAIEAQEVVVTAERGKLHKEVTSSQLVVTSEQIVSAVGVREVNSFLEKQPGVAKENGFLTIRGGSADQTGTMVNGLMYTNVSNGNAETSIPMSAIEQVSLLSGGYNAEYGNFRSGLINVVTKSGKKDRYHATVSVTGNIPHMKRFGPAFTDPKSPLLAPYLDAEVAFVGTAKGWKDNPYQLQQHDTFLGWDTLAIMYNQGKAAKDQVTPLDLYLFAAWMHMAKPDYDGLARLGYTVSDIQKKLFEQHAQDEEGMDSNIDFGFGGPFPFVSEALGDATFYLSHSSRETFYIMPVTRRSDVSHVTLATIKSSPIADLTISLNGLYKHQTGVTPLRPAFGDVPMSGREGGFMSEDNVKNFTRIGDGVYGMYMFDQAFYPLLEQTTFMGGLSVNHVLSKSTYWESSFSYLSTKDFSPVGDNRNNKVITHFGPILVSEMPYGKWQYAGGSSGSGSNKLRLIEGSDTLTYTHLSYDGPFGMNRRFRGKEGDLYTNVHTRQYRAKFDLNSQLDQNNYIKAGAEYNRFDINHQLWAKWNNNANQTYDYNYHRTPSQTGLYVQDQLNYDNIIANLGVRVDYFYGGGGLWPTGNRFAYYPFGATLTVDSSLFRILASGRSYIWEIWQAYNDTVDNTFLQPIKNHLTVSPRLGISFPISERAKFYFNYGHFRSNPPYYSMYLIRYRYRENALEDLPDPNLEPPKTVSYELGVAYNFYESYIATLSGYSKDVTGQTGEVNYTNAAGTVDYDAWANNNYEDIQGVELNITKNDVDWINGWVNFNYMLKKSGLTGRSLVTDVTINDDRQGLYEGQESRFLPQPRVSANITLSTPRDDESADLVSRLLFGWSASFFAEWKAGEYFTWNPLGKAHVNNNLQWPDYYMVDLRLSRAFSLYDVHATFYCDINNIFNIKVNLLSKRYAFNSLVNDFEAYMSSLHLSMYDSPEYNGLRNANPGKYIAGSDSPGETRSTDKEYINDPNMSYWIYGQPRDIWFGIRVDF